MSLSTDATDDHADDAGADDADDGDQVLALPTDQELAEYFRETWDSDGQPVTWVEYFGFEDIDGKPRQDLDDRVREFMMDHVGPQPDGA
jgi:hypothetical protein